MESRGNWRSYVVQQAAQLHSPITLFALLAMAYVFGWAEPVSPHPQSFSFAWTSGGSGTYLPDPHYAYNDAGAFVSVSVDASGVGRYHVRFLALDEIANPFDHVQVTAYGSGAESCQIVEWYSEAVDVACFDATGTDADTLFTVLFVKQEAHTREIAYALADQPSTTSYSADPNHAFNPTGGDVSVDRLGTGNYVVTFTGLTSVGANGGHVQVTAHGSVRARCKTPGWGPETVTVWCFDPSGSAIDAEFSVLYQKPGTGSEGLAFAWVEDASGPATPDPGYSFNSSGGAVESSRTTTGVYSIHFNDFDAVGVDQGNVHVTAYGTDDVFCHVSGWTPAEVGARCFDSTGSPANSRLNVLYWKTPRAPITRGFAFATGDQPTMSSYLADPATSFNPSGAPVSIHRSDVGRYYFSFPGLEDFAPSNWPVAVVSAADPTSGLCTRDGISTSAASVRCFDLAGNPADRIVDVLMWKPEIGTPGLAYAWAAFPTSPSYTPGSSFHNPTGGTITVTRSGTGRYTVDFDGYGAVDATRSHAQAVAVGSTPSRCEVVGWSGDEVEVQCTDVAGAPLDDHFSVVYLRLDEKRDGLAFAWADLISNPSYAPVAAYSYNASGDDIDLTRTGTGDYHVIAHGLEEVGIPGHLGHVQASSYGGAGNQCRTVATTSETADVVCLDPTGSAIDVKYDVLFVRPTNVQIPEPSSLAQLAAGVLGLLAMGHERVRQRRPRVRPRGSVVRPTTTPTA